MKNTKTTQNTKDTQNIKNAFANTQTNTDLFNEQANIETNIGLLNEKADKHQNKVLDFFLGTTIPLGFKGYFDALLAEKNMRPILMKSGPGCGKSTLMKKLADFSTENIERIHCASDPESLDGLIFTERKRCILDATSPHAIEPSAPGAIEDVLSLYHTMNREFLQSKASEITANNSAYRCLRLRIVRYISSAAGLLLDSRRAAACATSIEKCLKFANRFCDKEFKNKKTKGCEKIRLMSAITPKGVVFFKDNIPLLAKNITVLQDEYGAVSTAVLKQIRSRALASGYEIITCPCAMHPDDKIDHLFVPELKLAIVTSNSWHSVDIANQKNVSSNRFTDKELLRKYRARLRFNKKATAELLNECFLLLKKAKSTHDLLENIYTPAIDFYAIDKITLDIAKDLELI